MILFVCGSPEEGLEEAYARALSEAEALERDQEEDLQIERELGPWPSVDGWAEEIDREDLELVPMHVALNWREPLDWIHADE